MALLEMNAFAREDVFPSWFANAIQKALSTHAPSFQVLKKDATHIEVPASVEENAAIVTIAGKWRWSEVAVTRAHPGGAGGTYDIFVTAAANDIVSSPEPGTDDTNYAFALAILKAGETPAIKAGEVDIYRKVGSLQWSGAEITRVDQSAPLAPTHAHRHATGQPDAIAPADIGAAPEAGVTGSFSVGGTFSSTKPLDLSSATGTAAVAGGSTGDKIGLCAAGFYGIGIQSSRLVLYTPSGGGGIGIRATAAEGAKSSGIDSIFLGVSGQILVYGTTSNPFAARKVNGDANPYFAVAVSTGALQWGTGGGAATDITLERSGAGKLKVTGELESGVMTVNVTSANAFKVVDAEARQHFKVDSTEAVGRVTVGTTTSSTSKFYTSTGVLDALVSNQTSTEHYVVRFQQGGTDVFTILNGALTTTANVKVTNSVTVERAEGSTAFQTWVSGVSTINPWVVNTVGKMQWGAPTGALDVSLQRSAAGILKVEGTLQATKAVCGEASASANNATATVGVANVMQAPQNTVSLFVGYGGNVGAFTATEYSGVIRFGGSTVAWGDIAYFPKDVSNGMFRFYADANAVSTGVATADVGVHTLYVQGALAHRGTTLGFFNSAAVARDAGWGSPTPPGGTFKTVLTYESTLKNVIDSLESLKATLQTYGLLGV